MKWLFRRYRRALAPVEGCEQRRGFQHLSLLADLLEELERGRGTAPCAPAVTGFRVSRAEVLKRDRLTVEQAGCPVLQDRFLEAGDCFVKPVQSLVQAAQILQRVAFDVAAYLPADVARLDIAILGRPQVTKAEVRIPEIVDRGGAERRWPPWAKQVHCEPQVTERLGAGAGLADMRLGQRDGCLRLTPGIADFLPDG